MHLMEYLAFQYQPSPDCPCHRSLIYHFPTITLKLRAWNVLEEYNLPQTFKSETLEQASTRRDVLWHVQISNLNPTSGI